MVAQDILDEINAVACSEEDRQALLKLVAGMSPQLGRCYVALSRGSIGVLDAVLDANPYVRGDDRDLIMLAVRHVDYHCNYFIDPFSAEMKARKKDVGKG